MSSVGSRPFSVHLIFTTHWDREWVQTFDQYRFRLVNLVDRLLDILEAEPSLIFTFDGQSIVIEDYLEVRPEQQPRLQKLARAGRLVFGPWYVLGDQFLEGDEATIRNLLIGFRLCEAYGDPMLEGYVPDSFGSISTLPLILNGFGIRYANFGRGKAGFPEDNTNVCWWQSEDGSEVLAFNQGYANAIGLTYPDLWKDITRHTPNRETILANATRLLGQEGARNLRPLYFSTGVDHMEMRPGMSSWIEVLNQSTDAEWIPSTPFAFAAALEADLRERGLKSKAVRGEMRGSKESPMNLQGVLSTNREVKRLNRLCEILLARILEPLNVVQSAFTGSDYHASVTHAWKLVLQNHPHDSICACSLDDVIRDVLHRFHRVLELYSVTHERMLRNLLGTSFVQNEAAGPPAIALFNAVPYRGIASFKLVVRVPRRLEGKQFGLKNQSGQRIGNGKVLAYRKNDLETFYTTNRDLLKLDCKQSSGEHDSLESFTLLEVNGTADFGSDVGWNKFVIEEAGRELEPNDLASGPDWIGNLQLRVETDAEGRIRLQDLATGREYDQLFWFEDSADIGDSYDYQPLKDDVELTSLEKGNWESKITRDEEEATLALTVQMDIPSKSSENGRDLEKLTHRMEVHLTLRPGEKVLYAKVKFENKSINHRLRVGFRFKEEPKLLSGGHFTAIARDFGDGGDLFPCRPMTDYLHLDFSQGGLGILTKGLYEFEPRKSSQGADIYLTLCRSTESIGPAAGCNYPVNHTKELGTHELEFALVSSQSLPETIRHSMAYTVPLVGEALPAKADAKWGALLSLDNPDIILSAIKMAEDHQGYIVRLFNPLGKDQQAILKLHLPYRMVERVELSETSSSKANYSANDSGITISFGAHEVITFKFWSLNR